MRRVLPTISQNTSARDFLRGAGASILPSLNRTFARFRRFRGQDCASDRLEQRQIVVAARKGQSKRRLTAPKRKTRRVWPHQGIPLPSLFAASEPERASCRHRWGPQPGDQRQDVGERLPRVCDFGHLERDLAAVADDLRADLDQLLAQAGQRPGLCRLRT